MEEYGNPVSALVLPNSITKKFVYVYKCTKIKQTNIKLNNRKEEERKNLFETRREPV